MKPITAVLCVLLLAWGCGTPPRDRKSTVPDPAVESLKILPQAILFKVAAQIQEKYLQQYEKLFNNDEVKFFRYLDETVLSKSHPENRKPGQPAFPGHPQYRSCIAAVLQSDKSHWTIKKILTGAAVPDQMNRGSDVLFNPYVFLPEPPETALLVQDLDFVVLWELFYTAILLEEKELLAKVYPPMIKKVKEEYPRDRELFEGLYRLATGSPAGSARPCEAGTLALYYLISGNIDERLVLDRPGQQRLQEVIAHYNQNYYSTAYITINRYTLDHREYMWLAARQYEQAGDINKANVFIRTTFDNEVLRDVRKFQPNHQVYLYATMRIALKMHSPGMFRYVYGALDPLTKFQGAKLKETLKMQLLQLMN